MAQDNREPIPREAVEAPSAYPPGWPGIPGRSSEHEVKPGGLPWKQGDEASEAAVTRAQRELEHALHAV